MTDPKHYVNRSLPDSEVEAFVEDLLSKGWVITSTPEEGPSEVTFKNYGTLQTLKNGINKLAQEGYTLFEYKEVEDNLGVDPPSFQLEAWRPALKWRVQGYRQSGTMAA